MKLLKRETSWLTKPTIQHESTRIKKTNKKTTDYKNLKTSLVSYVEMIDTKAVAGMRLFDTISLKQEIFRQLIC